MTIENQYRVVRNRIRRLGYRESLQVIWAYAQFLQFREFQFPGGIEVEDQFLRADLPQGLIAEWTLEQLAREVVRHSGEAPRGRSLRRWSTLAEIVNGLRSIEDDIYEEHHAGERIHLELMRISHRQFVWQQQRPDWRGIVRYYKLFNTPEIVAICQQATGLSVDEVFLIGMAFLGSFIGQPRILEQMNIEIPGIDREKVDRFLEITSVGRIELSNMLRAEHALDEGFAYRYSSLRQFPLIRIQHGGQREIACPIPTLLFWRFTTGLYYALKDALGFPTAFGRSFQLYVGEVLRARITNQAMTVLAEAEFRVGNRRKDTVDWIVQHGDDAALFVECKTKRLTWASKAGLTDLFALERDIRKLAGAVVQVYRTIQDYRAGRYPQLAFVAGRQIFPAVVTLEDWYFFGNELPDRLDAAVRTAILASELPDTWLDEMPYSVMSLDEFEKVSGVMSSIGVRPVIAGKVQDEARRRWPYGSYCNDRYPEMVGNLPRLFHEDYDAMFADLLASAH